MDNLQEKAQAAVPEATAQQEEVRDFAIETPEGDMSQEKIIENAQKISSKALRDLTTNDAFDKYVEQLNKDPAGAISSYATMYTTKVRESGLNDLPIIVTAGSLIITGMTNMLFEAGKPDQAVTAVQAKAMESFMGAALQMDRAQNGYTESNTPPDQDGRTMADGPAPGSAPSALQKGV